MSKYSREELVASLRSLAAELGHSPSAQELQEAEGYPSKRQYLSVFGSWNKAKEAAGLETFEQGGQGKSYSRDELIDLLQVLAQHVDGRATRDDVDAADDLPSWMTYRRHFGSWNKAKEAAGLDPFTPQESHPEYTDEELLQLLRDRAADLDRPLTQSDVEQADDLPAISTFETRFGSWNKAKEQAGLDPVEKGQRNPEYTDSELLDRLRAFADQVEGQVTAAKLSEADDFPAPTTYKRRFGSWSKAKELAGIK